MSSNDKKIKLKDAINMCGYQKNIRQNFIKFLETTYGSQKHKLYVFARNDSAPKLFLLQMQIPALFNNQSYDISLLVYFPLNFPDIEPEIFFEKIGKVKINPNCAFYVDEDTLKINYSLFYSWEKSFESFKGLINELYNQFNIAFPIFNLSDKNKEENFDDQSDCVLKKNLCVEVELIKPIIIQPKTTVNNNQNQKYSNNINNNFNNQMNQMNDLNIGMNNLNIQNPKEKYNIYGKKMGNNDPNFNNIDNNANPYIYDNKIATGNNRNNPYQVNNYNYGKNQVIDTNGNKNIPVFNENQSKALLINVLQNNLSIKINNAIQPITNSYLKLDGIKSKIIKKLKDFEKVESKENAIRQTINSLKKEMDFTISSPKEIGKPDLNNLENVLIISNKDYYLRLSKEKAIEEYILIIKKSYEKRNIEFNTALNLIRTNSRNIFFLKYKNANPFGY